MDIRKETNQLLEVYRKNHDIQIRNQIFEYNIGLIYLEVNSFIRCYSLSNSKDVRDELIQLASLGLLEAIEKFDPSKGTSLGSFSSRFINNSLRSYFSENRIIYLPKDVTLRINKIKETRNELLSSLHRQPTIEEIAVKLNLSTEEVENALLYDKMALMNDDLEEAESIHFSQSAEESALNEMKNDAIEKFLESLSDKEREILISHKLLDQPYQTCADKYHLSIVRVREIEQNCLKRLKKILETL